MITANTMQETTTKTRNYSLDLLRILACITVILCHTAGSPLIAHHVEPGTLWYNECLFMHSLTRWDIAIFVMLPGFFLLNPKKDVTISAILGKYVMRVLGALIFWSLFYGLTLRKSLYPLGTQEGHFWYLEMIIWVYLSIPILRLVAVNQKLTRYFIYVWLFYQVYTFIGAFVTMPIKIQNMVFANFAGFALLAYHLKTVFVNPEDPKKTRRLSHVIYIFGIIGLVVSVASCLISQDEENIFMSFSSPNTIAISVAMFVFAICHPLNLPQRKGEIVENIARCTFGVYLTHIWVLIMIYNRLHRFIQEPIPLVLICVATAFVTGIVVTYFLRKIPFCRKYIV